MTRAFQQVDVFTKTPYAGNPVAVVLDGTGLTTDAMQRFAQWTNLSETTFVLPPDDPQADYRVRIFTPVAELPFAGHPTLGSAFVLAAPLDLPEVALETGAGIVPVSLERDENGRVSFGRMRQPIPTWQPYDRVDELLAALGLAGSELPVEIYDNGVRHVYVALRSRDEVAALRPDLGRLVELPGALGFNCFAGDGGSWKTRMFAPVDGVPEDPATGSAAGPLAVHLVRHGRIGFGDEIEISQGEELRRPSKLYARVEGEGDRIDVVEVGGSAVIVARGEFKL
jgi:trans-2,3-dihydro-3-hydroxyanthranilate isomerase